MNDEEEEQTDLWHEENKHWQKRFYGQECKLRKKKKISLDDYMGKDWWNPPEKEK